MSEQSKEGRPYDLKQIYEVMRRDAIPLMEELLAGIRSNLITAYYVAAFTAAFAALLFVLFYRAFPVRPLWQDIFLVTILAVWIAASLSFAYGFYRRYRLLTHKYKDLIRLARSEGLDV